MTWVNGRYVLRKTANTEAATPSQDETSIYRGPVALEEVQIEDGFFTESLLSTKFVEGSFTAAILKRLLPEGVISVANGMRSLFSSGFVNRDLIAADAVSGSKISNPIKLSIISGGAAGTHTVTGIRTGDELISVLEQNGTSGLLTDLTTEFAIATSDTITNSGGTATSGDNLIVLYLDKTTDLTLMAGSL